MKHIQQYVRCYTEPVTGDQTTPARNPPRRSRESAEAKAIKAIGAPYEGWCLTFDCETTMDAAQQLRFGIYQVNGISRDDRIFHYRTGTLDRELLDTLHDVGIFYNPDTMSSDEIAIIEEFAQSQQLTCMTVEEFITKVFYLWVYRRGALCIGHNLAFDLSRLATSWGAIERGPFNGGFWLTLCSCGHPECFDHPPLRIKHIGRPKQLVDFRSTSVPLADGSVKTRRERGKFLNTMTLGRALLGPGPLDLRGLGKRAGVEEYLLKELWQG